WVDLDLKVHAWTGIGASTILDGTARNPDGETIPVRLGLAAPDLAGTWVENGEASLPFSRGSLEWDQNERIVNGKARGKLWGCEGIGEFRFDTSSPFHRAWVKLEAKESAYDRWRKANKWIAFCSVNDAFERYQQSASKDLWWGCDTVLLCLDVSVDHCNL